ncbi:MAG: OmpA family protein [Proteobacteria bacterium]|nr:OmpA family protein [Pseudomonadota bacterium]
MTVSGVPNSGFPKDGFYARIRKITRVLTVVLCLLVLTPSLSGCLRFGLESLHMMEIKGTPYQLAIVKEYMAFSESEAKQYDWISADHFARKAIAVLEGREIAPEELKDWDIPETMLPPLVKARADLMKFVTDDMKRDQPAALAAAMESFDCWVEQQEENWQMADIAACRDRFYEQLNILNEATDGATIAPEAMEEVTQEENVVAEDVAAEDAAPAKATAKPAKRGITIETPITSLNPLAKNKDEGDANEGPAAPHKKAVRSETGASYVVYFDAGKTTLGRDGMVVVNKIVTDLRDDKDFEVVLNGYADQSGNKDFIQSMADKRAASVKKALVDRGIDEDAVTAQGLGAGSVKTPIAPQNRRVEVFIVNQKTK